MSQPPENMSDSNAESAPDAPVNAEAVYEHAGDIAAATALDGKPESDAVDPRQNLDRIFKLKIPVIVKVAEKQMKLSAVLKLTMGSIIQFEKDAYQHVDLMVNNSTIGLGQPVKIGENFGLRVTQIGDLTDTIRILGSQDK